jgi:hypothetical protein
VGHVHSSEHTQKLPPSLIPVDLLAQLLLGQLLRDPRPNHLGLLAP